MQPPRLRACSEICASFLPWPKPSSMTVAGTRRALPYGFDDADLPPKANNRDITARTRIVNIIHIVKYISRPSFRGFIRSGRRSWSRATKVPYRLGRPFRPLAANPESVVGVSAPRGSRGALPPAACLSSEAPILSLIASVPVAAWRSPCRLAKKSAAASAYGSLRTIRSIPRSFGSPLNAKGRRALCHAGCFCFGFGERIGFVWGLGFACLRAPDERPAARQNTKEPARGGLFV